MSYEPRFTLSSSLSRHLNEIAVLREEILCAAARAKTAAVPKNRPARFTLDRAFALANGEDFPVVTDGPTRQMLDWFTRRLKVEGQSGWQRWTHEDVCKVHTLVAGRDAVNPRSAGRYRQIAVRAGVDVPPAPRSVPRLMSDLLEWWGARGLERPAVVTSAIVHYRIADIHPFVDGNGRLGRALAWWELYRRGFDNPLLLSLKEPYWGQRRDYYRAFRGVSRSGKDLTAWLEYNAQALGLALKQKSTCLLTSRHRFADIHA